MAPFNAPKTPGVWGPQAPQSFRPAEGQPKPGRAEGPLDPAAEPPDKGVRGARPPAFPPARGSRREPGGGPQARLAWGPQAPQSSRPAEPSARKQARGFVFDGFPSKNRQ